MKRRQTKMGDDMEIDPEKAAKLLQLNNDNDDSFASDASEIDPALIKSPSPDVNVGGNKKTVQVNLGNGTGVNVGVGLSASGKPKVITDVAVIKNGQVAVAAGEGSGCCSTF